MFCVANGVGVAQVLPIVVSYCSLVLPEERVNTIDATTIVRNIALSVRALGYIFKEVCNPQKSISPLLTVLLHFMELSLPFKISPKLTIAIHTFSSI
jgi:hypothetical protein